MTAFNIVRMRVKSGCEDEILEVARAQRRDHLVGLRSAHLINIGERTYYFVGKWDSMEHIVAARPLMIKNLDASRPFLENLGEGIGEADGVAGNVVATLYRRPEANRV